MNLNISVMVLGILFVIILIIKIIQNHVSKKQKRKKKTSILSTTDIINVLFNVGLLTAGIASILLAIGLSAYFFGKELAFTQPIINFLAGVLFIWFAIRNIFYGGKV